jgi:hypothetical protein
MRPLVPTRAFRWLWASALLAACGAPRPLPPASAPAPAAGPDPDVCEGSPPVPHALHGVLRNARCDQDMYYSMSKVADMLGVACPHCHAPKGADPKDRDFPVMTRNKEIANWMSTELMQAIKPADGSALKCSSCHTDEKGQPVAKILGEPRSRVKANEWMSLVLVKKFVAADGSKLRCQSCHVGSPGTADYQPAVLLRTGQLPAHAAAVKGTPAF